MDSIRKIQESMDEHKNEMPTGVATRVMEQCQMAYDMQPELYVITWTIVESHSHIEHVEDDEDVPHVNLTHKTQSLIVEAVDAPPIGRYGSQICAIDMPHHGMILRSWTELTMPRAMKIREDDIVIVHSIVPYEPRNKRMRDNA